MSCFYFVFLFIDFFFVFFFLFSILLLFSRRCTLFVAVVVVVFSWSYVRVAIAFLQMLHCLKLEDGVWRTIKTKKSLFGALNRWGEKIHKLCHIARAILCGFYTLSAFMQLARVLLSFRSLCCIDLPRSLLFDASVHKCCIFLCLT